jgi:hypothetical protein
VTCSGEFDHLAETREGFCGKPLVDQYALDVDRRQRFKDGRTFRRHADQDAALVVRCWNPLCQAGSAQEVEKLGGAVVHKHLFGQFTYAHPPAGGYADNEERLVLLRSDASFGRCCLAEGQETSHRQTNPASPL